MSKSKILVVGDTHMPWMDKGCYSWLMDLAAEMRPEVIVQVGDLYDMFSQGRWARSYDLITPKQELVQGREQAEEFWAMLQKRAPGAKCFQIKGNHDDRPMKKVIEKAPELTSLLDINHLWNFKKVTTIHDSKKELIIDDIAFMHGFRSQLGAHARFNQMKTVCGHSHRGGVVYMPIRGLKGKSEIIWELNAGYLGDPAEVPLQYSAQSLINWTQGAGFIDKRGPRFIPKNE
jgi:predicted phosphodiesterase